MLPYLILLILSLFAATINIYKKQLNSPLLFGILFFLFVLLVAFTDGNGLDWYGTNYTEGYALIDYRSLGFEELVRFEPGFVLVNIILGNFHLFLFTMSVVCFMMVWDVIKKNCTYKYIALFVYISSMTLYCYMGVYRHAIAQTIIIFSWNYINDRKKMALCLLAACLFHYSAVIAFLYLLIPKKRVFTLRVCFVLLLMAFIIRPLLQPILTMVAVLALPGETAGKINLYLSGDDMGSGISMLLLLYKMFVFLFAYKYLRTSGDKLNNFLINTYFISILLFMTITISPTFGRLVMFFSCVEILIMPLTIYQLVKRGNRTQQGSVIPLMYFSIISILSFYSYIKMLYDFSNIYLPYKSILI